MLTEKPQPDPKSENIQAFLDNNELWGISTLMRYGLADSTIRLELGNVRLLFSRTVIAKNGSTEANNGHLHVKDAPTTIIPDIINFASITKPFFSAALIKLLQEQGLNLESYRVTIASNQKEALIKETQQAKYEAIREDLKRDLDTGEISLRTLLKLANKYSSNEATSIIKQELVKLAGGSELAIEKYIQDHLDMTHFQMNREPGIWELPRANSGSIQEAAIAFNKLTEYGYEFLDDMQENDVNFKFDLSGSNIKQEIEKRTGCKVKKMWEKTGFFPQIRWGRELTTPENGNQPVQMIMISLFTIEFEDEEKITVGQYFLAGRPMLDDATDPNQQHTEAKRIDLLNDHLRAEYAYDFRSEAIEKVVNYLQNS